MSQSSSTHDFDVAFSFAGADREFATAVAAVATANGLNIFFDEGHTADLWGKNLTETLSPIYDGRAEYCLVFISDEYVNRPFTRLERRFALDRAIELRREYILPVRLDDAWLEGLPRSTAYLDCRNGRMTPIDVGRSVVEKLRGRTAQVPANVAEPKVIRVDRSHFKADSSKREDAGALEFVHIQPLANRNIPSGAVWKETSDGEFECYPSADPVFDLTVLNTVERNIVLTRVGVEVIGLGFEILGPFGGGGATPIDLHRVYQLDLPDLWRRLGELQREAGVRYEKLPWSVSPVKAAELVACKLPDPILLEPSVPYRFGLQLFDYHVLCPNIVDLQFWAKTSGGDARSSPVRLRYLIGTHPPGHNRFVAALNILDMDQTRRIAYEQWEMAGRPEGRADEFWQAAQEQLASINRSIGSATSSRRRQVRTLSGDEPSPA